MIAAVVLHPDQSAEIVEQFRTAGIELQIKNNLEDAANCSAALIFGGDGTIRRYLRQLSRRHIPTLVVPLGSGNDFAKALGISSVMHALQAWKQFCAAGKNVHQIDLGVIKPLAQGSEEELFFCNAVAIGMDAAANARANCMPAWIKGRGGYLLAALQSLVTFKAVELDVTAEERKIRGSSFFLAVGNARRYGGGMMITPQAAMDDGLLDVCLVSRMNKLKLLCWMPAVFFGGHLRLQGVEYFQSQAVRVEAGRELEVYADGDFACKTPVEIRVLSRALPVIVPASISL
ncbi:MAG TPA: YegS/Rv2252/BmrU family lipid kinase [Candidatus Angelobacter sp.]|nr:YegS/Rv2252/BmrU family lipid kinase [Candidatus Angelobacter sp.]